MAHAQSNPFVPPQASISKAQIEQMVRQEVERTRVQGGKTGAPGANPSGVNPSDPTVRNAVGGAPQQPGGTPVANTAAAPEGPDPVAELLKDSGMFVGCVSGTPVFKDKLGRRAYFTTKELRESNEARRFARCS